MFTYFYVPETRDRTLEEIHEMFEARLPARKFKGYVCASTQAMQTAGGKDTEVHELENAPTAENTDKSATAKTAQV